MARLQDFQTVTPTDSDNLLVVQATGQGLATVGSTLGAKMDKANPTGTGSLSINRKSGTTEGGYSMATGYQATASGGYSQAGGYRTVAEGTSASAFGTETIANHAAQHVFGMYNLADTSAAAATSKGNYIEIVGKGTSDSVRSNARTLDWNGNEVLAGGLKINGNKDVAIQSDFTVTAGALTNINSALTGGSYTLTRSGKICVLSLYKGITGSIGGTAELATLPSGFIPYADTKLVAISTYNGSYNSYTAQANSNGKLVVSTGSGSFTSAISIIGTYICS